MSHGSGALFATLKMAGWQIKEIPFGNHELWKQMLPVLSPSRSLMQMLRVGDSSMINQTGSKLLHKAMPLQLSSLLPEPINLGDTEHTQYYEYIL